MCFLVGAECTKLSSPPRLPTPQFTRSLRASLKVTLNTSTFTSCIQSHSKRVQPPGSPWPLMFSPSTESTHSHTWIPATTCLGSEFQTHTPISSSPSTFHLSNSHFRICFLPPNPSMVPTSSGQTPNSSIQIQSCSWSSRVDSPPPTSALTFSSLQMILVQLHHTHTHTENGPFNICVLSHINSSENTQTQQVPFVLPIESRHKGRHYHFHHLLMGFCLLKGQFS